MGYVFLCFKSSSSWLGSHSFLFHQPCSWEPEIFFSRGAQPPGSSLLCSYHLPSAMCSGEMAEIPIWFGLQGTGDAMLRLWVLPEHCASGTTPASSNKGETYFLLAVVPWTSLRVFSGKWVIGRAEFRHSWFFWLFFSLNHFTEVWLTYKQLSIFNTYKLICWEINIHLWTHHHCHKCITSKFPTAPFGFLLVVRAFNIRSNLLANFKVLLIIGSMLYRFLEHLKMPWKPQTCHSDEMRGLWQSQVRAYSRRNDAGRCSGELSWRGRCEHQHIFTHHLHKHLSCWTLFQALGRQWWAKQTRSLPSRNL